MQRLTAVLLVPLGLWFVASLLGMSHQAYASLLFWLRSPLTAVLLLGTLVAAYYHALLGLQVVIEDYVDKPGSKLASLLLVRCILFLAGLSAVLAVVKLFLTDRVVPL